MKEKIEISKLKGVLFDLGGTLIRFVNNPSEDHYHEFIKMIDPGDIRLTYYDFCVFIDTYWKKMQDEFYSAPIGLTIDEYNQNFLTGYGFSYSSVLNIAHKLDEFLWRIEVDGTEPMKHAVDLLECVKSHGLKLGLVTNASHHRERINELMRKTRIESFFDAVVISSEFGVMKPDPSIFLKALDDLGLNQSECVYIGDRMDYDGKGAENVGMDYILVGPDISLKTIMDWFECGN